MLHSDNCSAATVNRVGYKDHTCGIREWMKEM